MPRTATDETAAYLPTPAEIEAACQDIQAGWDETIREKRRAVPPVTPEVARCELRGVGGDSC